MNDMREPTATHFQALPSPEIPKPLGSEQIKAIREDRRACRTNISNLAELLCANQHPISKEDLSQEKITSLLDPVNGLLGKTFDGATLDPKTHIPVQITLSEEAIISSPEDAQELAKWVEKQKKIEEELQLLSEVPGNELLFLTTDPHIVRIEEYEQYNQARYAVAEQLLRRVGEIPNVITIRDALKFFNTYLNRPIIVDDFKKHDHRRIWRKQLEKFSQKCRDYYDNNAYSRTSMSMVTTMTNILIQDGILPRSFETERQSIHNRISPDIIKTFDDTGHVTVKEKSDPYEKLQPYEQMEVVMDCRKLAEDAFKYLVEYLRQKAHNAEVTFSPGS